jgi:hypothetical protein
VPRHNFSSTTPRQIITMKPNKRIKLKYIYAHMYCKVKQTHGHMLTLQVFSHGGFGNIGLSCTTEQKMLLKIHQHYINVCSVAGIILINYTFKILYHFLLCCLIVCRFIFVVANKFFAFLRPWGNAFLCIATVISLPELKHDTLKAHQGSRCETLLITDHSPRWMQAASFTPGVLTEEAGGPLSQYGCGSEPKYLFFSVWNYTAVI